MLSPKLFQQVIISKNRLVSPARLQTELTAPSLVQSVIAVLGTTVFDDFKKILFKKIRILPRSKTKKYEPAVRDLFKKFGVPLHDGDIEHVSACMTATPCTFVTDDSGMLQEAFVKHMQKTYRIRILPSPQFFAELTAP